ncbi:hypothetical protein [Streptomyces megasporus]|uniref:hypothetical protein n=1 Tax=Streptomyces megasporus TaxID=44060 RepID=UPI0004E0BBCB|nr:hypothetical protein [Streptomyces megasporus]
MEEAGGTSNDPVSVRIGQAVMLHRGGDREEARNRLALLWEETAEAGDPFHRCAVAHYLAATQDDPGAALEWDLRALAAAEALTGDGAAGEEHRSAARSLYPSLHLRLAADHAGLGDPDAARRELARARRAVAELPDDAYGVDVKAAIDRLEARLAAPDGLGGADAGGQSP